MTGREPLSVEDMEKVLSWRLAAWDGCGYVQGEDLSGEDRGSMVAAAYVAFNARRNVYIVNHTRPEQVFVTRNGIVWKYGMGREGVQQTDSSRQQFEDVAFAEVLIAHRDSGSNISVRADIEELPDWVPKE